MKEKIIKIGTGAKLTLGLHSDGDGYSLELKDLVLIRGSWIDVTTGINLSSDDLYQIMKAIGTELRKKSNCELHYCEEREHNGLNQCERICRHCKYVESCTE